MTKSSLALPTAMSYARRSDRPVFSLNGWRMTSSASLTAVRPFSTSSVVREHADSAASSWSLIFLAWVVAALRRESCSLILLSVYVLSLLVYCSLFLRLPTCALSSSASCGGGG